MTIKIFPTPFKLAERFAEELIRMVKESADKRRTFTIALSGGITPKLLFSVLGERFLNSVPWEYVHFFWGDERCVPPDNSDSNFGMTDKVFLEKIKIPPENIHRIKGEKDPEEEAVRYSDEIARFTGERGGLPLFDLIILGLGEDGHTASIFPGNNMLLNSEKICDIAIHPLSFQKRITITGNVINNAENVIFLVTGAHKAKVVSDIIERRGTVDYPAAHIEPQQGILQWYLDDAAAKMIDKRTLIDFRYK
jgi:6-phosphogluconolactonase